MATTNSMGVSRSKQVAKNSVVSLATQAVMLLLNFFLRTVFIRTLDIDYLGVSGLFSGVLSILSFAELGIGNAIIFSLYKPIAYGDEKKLCSLMHLYKVVYRVIFAVVLALGLLLIPFLHFFIKGDPHISESLTVIYLLYLVDTAVSYLYIYKQSIIQADQKGYVVTTILTISNFIKVLLQIAILYLFHNFILFLIIQIVCRIAGNLYCSYVVNRQYPYIRLKPMPLEKSESKRIFKDVKSMAAYKFGSIILNSSDSVIISSMISITTTGLLSNYSILCVACKTILGGITSSFTASIGNHNAVATEDEKYNAFNKLLLITAWLWGLVAVGLIVVSNNLVEVWLGKEYVMSIVVIMAMVFEFYVGGIHTLESHYRTTMGFFVKGRFAPVFAACLNIVLSILFCLKWGVAGVFIATSISRILTLGIVDSYIIYKDGFHRQPVIYFIKNFGYIALFVGIGLLCWLITSFISFHNWFSVILQGIIVFVLYNVIMLAIFHRTKEFKEVLNAFRFVLKSRYTN